MKIGPGNWNIFRCIASRVYDLKTWPTRRTTRVSLVQKSSQPSILWQLGHYCSASPRRFLADRNPRSVRRQIYRRARSADESGRRPDEQSPEITLRQENLRRRSTPRPLLEQKHRRSKARKSLLAQPFHPRFSSKNGCTSSQLATSQYLCFCVRNLRARAPSRPTPVRGRDCSLGC